VFADAALAARIDATEAALCTAVAETIEGAVITEIGGGRSIFARPGSPVNKVIGLGFEGALEERALAELERRGPVRAEVATLADPSVVRALTARGYRVEGFENVLGVPLPSPRAPDTSGIDVSLTADAAAWGAIMVEGFVHPDETSGHAETYPREAIEAVFTDFLLARGFRRYLARLDGEPAGAASLFVHRDVAFLAGATTLPTFRRRGVQNALLARRLADAAVAGCSIACMTTAPGTRSQKNAQRNGFSLLYARAVVVGPP
jgi:hypothetical protein